MARRFATTWWGQAWIDALENRARLDPNRLPRGRTYARQDRVLDMQVEPGAVSALVRGTRPHPYSVRVRVREFAPHEWDRVLDAIAGKARFAAAMLDGEMDPGVVDAVSSVGIELFPTAGELIPRCSCPDWADPCKHSAAVCYLVADRLDVDPFELLLLRGMDRSRVMTALRARRSAASAVSSAVGGAVPEPTVPAREAWTRTLGVLPPVPLPPRRRARPAPWPSDPPAGSGVDPWGLRLLAEDAVRRAHEMVSGEGDSGLSLDGEADAARRASADDPAAVRALAAATGLSERELRRRGRVWAVGGAEALRADSEPAWTPDPLVMAQARQRLSEAGVRSVRVGQNAITWGNRRIRLAHDGRWWPMEKVSGRWEISGGPSADPEDLAFGT